jgi:1-acyl-sn-glycerol-3-phosphate acyltransferase
MWRGESALDRWRRRALSVPGLVLFTAIHTALLPLLLLHGAFADLLRRRPLLLCRFHLTIWSCLAWHCVGVALLGIWWLIGKALRMDQRRWRAWHVLLEGFWADRMIGIARVFYGLRLEVEGAELARPGPVLILMRHASVVDTMLPSALLGRRPHRMLMRIIKKRELLWDPCVDLVSHRVPRTFVRRGRGSTDKELEAIRTLTHGMAADDGLVIFPEGTRFSDKKRAEVLGKLEARDPAAAERAEALRHVLPIRSAGTLAVLEERPDVDVVFCAHTGLEGASRLEDFVAGALLRRTWRIQFWRVPRAEVPVEREARIAWLEAWWRQIDEWIHNHRS